MSPARLWEGRVKGAFEATRGADVGDPTGQSAHSSRTTRYQHSAASSKSETSQSCGLHSVACTIHGEFLQPQPMYAACCCVTVNTMPTAPIDGNKPHLSVTGADQIAMGHILLDVRTCVSKAKWAWPSRDIGLQNCNQCRCSATRSAFNDQDLPPVYHRLRWIQVSSVQQSVVRHTIPGSRSTRSLRNDRRLT
jgi:hypothetical protein